jgi:hypothetical protein
LLEVHSNFVFRQNGRNSFKNSANICQKFSKLAEFHPNQRTKTSHGLNVGQTLASQTLHGNFVFRQNGRNPFKNG